MKRKFEPKQKVFFMNEDVLTEALIVAIKKSVEPTCSVPKLKDFLESENEELTLHLLFKTNISNCERACVPAGKCYFSIEDLFEYLSRHLVRLEKGKNNEE